MIKQFFLLFSLFLICSDLTAQKAEKHISYYSNQNIKEEGYYVDKQKDGVWKSYFTNGKIRYERIYEKGVADGPFIMYALVDNDYYLNVAGTYLNGNLHGKYKFYDKNGRLIKTVLYENGKDVTSSNTGSSPEASSSAVSSQAKSKAVEIHYRVHFKNNCIETINLLLRYKTLQGNWITKGWSTIKPGEEAYIEDTKNSVVYYYAKSGSLVWTGDETRNFQGKDYKFKKLSYTGGFGKKSTTLKCTSLKKKSEQKATPKSAEYRLYFNNKTSNTVTTIVRYQSTSGSWVTKGWYTIKAGQEIYVDDMKSKLVLYHAKSNSRIWKGTSDRDFKGKSYGFRKLTFTSDQEKKVINLNY